MFFILGKENPSGYGGLGSKWYQIIG